MPRPPSSAARFGTRFHAWVEARFGQQDLFDYGDLPGRADAGIDDESDLKELIATFEAGPFATRTPLQVEAPFAVVLAALTLLGWFWITLVLRVRYRVSHRALHAGAHLPDGRANLALSALVLLVGLGSLAYLALA